MDARNYFLFKEHGIAPPKVAGAIRVSQVFHCFPQCFSARTRSVLSGAFGDLSPQELPDELIEADPAVRALKLLVRYLEPIALAKSCFLQ